MRRSIDEALEEILPGVIKPARYVGGELNAVVKNHAACDVRVALAFPDCYEIGMSNLAIQILYHLLNTRDDCVAERVFAPWPDMEAAMRARGLPLTTLETRTPVRDYDLLGFSLAFELGYPTVLNMLDLAQMPVRAADRDAGRWPLVIAGGHGAMNPEPMAPFIDAFVIGEGEEALIEIVETVKAHRESPRADLLRRLAHIPGVYVPRFYAPRYANATDPMYTPADARFAEADRRPLAATHPVEPGLPAVIVRRWIADVDALPYPTSPVVPFTETVHDRISLEVMRGCTRGCRFCQAGMITRPVREKSPERLLELSEQQVRGTGHEEISLVSLSTSDHSQVETLVSHLVHRYGDRRIGVSLPSLRADRDCVRLAEQIQRVRKSGLTFAPEAGTQRLRDAINKSVTEEALLGAVESAFASGWRRVKLYFMISLPTETDEDVAAIADLATRVARLGRRMGVRGVAVGVGVSTLVPKAHTPFQWAGQDSVEEVDRKQRLLRERVGDRAVEIRRHDARQTHVEAVLSRGDRRVAEVIERVWRAGGVLEAWEEHFRYDRWLTACEEAGVDPHFVANRPRDLGEPLPWDHIDAGVSKGYLRAEAKRAVAGTPTGDCHTGPCTFCGACDRAIGERRSRCSPPELP
ncbi:MAG TPA: TIGR03960 family B12-binding radical SAM protein [Chthonomonadales bacterium]|nr:TIGR03960 family B12-binding radical SAM protein [Chthonomonadales bacterium]